MISPFIETFWLWFIRWNRLSWTIILFFPMPFLSFMFGWLNLLFWAFPFAFYWWYLALNLILLLWAIWLLWIFLNNLVILSCCLIFLFKLTIVLLLMFFFFSDYISKLAFINWFFNFSVSSIGLSYLLNWGIWLINKISLNLFVFVGNILLQLSLNLTFIILG